MTAKPLYWLVNLYWSAKRKVLKRASGRSVIDEFMRSRQSFKHVINNIAGNPETLYALLSHPKIQKALGAQAHFLSALAASPDVVKNILQFCPPETRIAAIRSIFHESEEGLRGLSSNPLWVQAYLNIKNTGNVPKEDGDDFVHQKFINSILDLAGENSAQLLSYMLSRHPSLVQHALSVGELRDQVIYAVSKDGDLCSQILAFASLNSSLGANKRERIAHVLRSGLFHPLVFNAAAADAQFVSEISRALFDLADLTGKTLAKNSSELIVGELPASPAATLGSMTEAMTDDEVGRFAASVYSWESIRRLEQTLDEVGKKRGRLGMRDNSKNAFLDYATAVIRNDSVPMKTGSFRVADTRGFATTAEEILVKEEYFCDIGPTPFIIDCGANIGLSIFYFKSNFPKAKILAFEPVPSLYKIAMANLEAFHFEDVTVQQVAIASKAGIVELQVDSANSLAASLTDRRAARGGSLSTITVEAIELAGVIDRPVDLLKMDIEGVEYDVILSLGDRIRRVHYLFCEFHADDEVARQKMAKMLLFLGENGFSYQIARTAWAEHAYARKPLTFADKPISYGIYAVNTRWENRG